MPPILAKAARVMRDVRFAGAGLAGIGLVLALWWLLAEALRGSFLLASPADVARWLVQNAGLTLRALNITLRNAALGFAAGNIAAILLAFAAILWPRAQQLITGLALVIFCLPLLATAPILRTSMGPGNGPQITLAALAVYYTTLIALLTGLRATPSAWLDLVHTYGRGRLTELAHIRARAALPYLFAGLQIAAPAALLAAMVGEFTGAERGLGVLTIRFMRALDVTALWSVGLVAAAVSLIAYGLIGWLSRVMLDQPPALILSPPPPPARGRLAGLVGIAVTTGAVLLLWWALVRGLNPFFAKGPAEILPALIWAPDAAELRQTLRAALGETAVFLLPGYLAGLLAGAGLAVLLVLRPGLSAAIMPLALALRAIPIVTTAPLIMVLLGRGGAATIAIVAVMVFFPTLVACLHGLRQAPAQALDLARVYGAGPLPQMIHIRLPAMLPALFAAARMSVPAAILAVTVAEWLTTGRGLGGLMALAASLSDYRMLWSTVVVVTVISATFHGVTTLIERRVLALYAPEQLRR